MKLKSSALHQALNYFISILENPLLNPFWVENDFARKDTLHAFDDVDLSFFTFPNISAGERCLKINSYFQVKANHFFSEMRHVLCRKPQYISVLLWRVWILFCLWSWAQVTCPFVMFVHIYSSGQSALFQSQQSCVLFLRWGIVTYNWTQWTLSLWIWQHSFFFSYGV